MQKNKLIKNTFLLILGGFLTKILGFIIKILYTRTLKDEGVALITLVFPTYSLLLTISSFALPSIVTKFIAENKQRKSKILFSSFWITFIINLFLIVFFILFAKYFSNIFLHDNRCSILIKILCFTLPFISVTSLIKAYFFGIENVVPVIFSNVAEEIIKLILIITLLPYFVQKGVLTGVIFYLIINLICEIISFIILYFFLPKRIKISNLCYKYDQKFSHQLIKVSTPILSGKLIGNIGYFVEPIILTALLLYKGFDKNYIILNYGYFQGYVITLLTIPSFFLLALSSNLLPIISKQKINKNYLKLKRITVNIIIFVFIGSLLFISILFFYGKEIMILLYNSSNGYNYLKILLPFFILFYLENPLLTILQGLDQEKKIFKITTFGIILKYLSLIIFVILDFGFISLIYAEILNILFIVCISIFYLKKCFVCFFQ